MERETLQRLLRTGGHVAQQCADALAQGAEFELWPDRAPKMRLVSLYARRERTLQKTGQPSIGFTAAVEDLRAYPGEILLTGYVDDRPNDGYHFQIFTDPSMETLIACLGVRPSPDEPPPT
ncbi:hypothetical protein [Streptomyces sp. H51]|uniref:hypothetical protein n=1 Tax=Streptomyces sp. H51 TaxID=3111770 RepID=UPI002D7A0D81|nr:hypothetical protein [Streptomyces sp. H51]